MGRAQTAQQASIVITQTCTKGALLVLLARSQMMSWAMVRHAPIVRRVKFLTTSLPNVLIAQSETGLALANGSAPSAPVAHTEMKSRAQGRMATTASVRSVQLGSGRLMVHSNANLVKQDGLQVLGKQHVLGATWDSSPLSRILRLARHAQMESTLPSQLQLAKIATQASMGKADGGLV